MAVIRNIMISISLVCSLYVLNGHAQTGEEEAAYDEARGELLYSIHCIACHDKEIHWRDKKLAINWETLNAQVNRWQKNLGLEWTQQDIADVTGYLNAVYYHFPVFLKNGLSENEAPISDVIR